jgi:SPX domain protein involved in polyphosphate accumulation
LKKSAAVPLPDVAPSAVADPATPEAIMTGDRLETKYLVAPERVAGLARAIGKQVPKHRYVGPGASRLAEAHHFATTVYFDTPTHALWKAACADVEHNVKVRAREYYDLRATHPSAVADAREVPFEPTIWLELKRRHENQSSKHRFKLDKPAVPAFLQGAHSVPNSVASNRELEDIARFCRAVSGPLSASFLVNYRRLAFQNEAVSLRVTIDMDVAFYAPPADLWTRKHALTRGTLGPILGQEARAVVEVKRRTAMPDWLESAISDAHGEPVSSFSKFIHAGRAVFGSAG